MHDALYSQPYCSANNLGVDILFHLRPHPTADIEVRNVWKAVYLQHVNVATTVIHVYKYGTHDKETQGIDIHQEQSVIFGEKN